MKKGIAILLALLFPTQVNATIKANCDVVEVSPDRNEVYIQYGNDIYSFKANETDCRIGDRITITFSEDMEIVNAN